MSTTPTFGALRGPLVDQSGNPSRDFLKKMQEWEGKLAAAITLFGTIASTAKIQGRTEGIGTTASQLTSAGQLITADAVAADGSVFSRNTIVVGSAVVVENGNFESSAAILPPPGWVRYVDQAVGLAYDTATPISGLQSLRITTTALGQGGIISVTKYVVRPNDVFRISAKAKVISGAGAAIIALTFRNASGVGLLDAIASTSSGVATFISGSAIAPAGTVYATIELYSITANTAFDIDEVHIARMQTAFEVTPINTAGTPTSTTGLCAQHGAGLTQIDISASTWQFGDGQANYNSGSVDPGILGTYYIYADDPGYNGGAVTYIATTTPAIANAANGRLFFGKITTAAGVATSTGGGSGGGGPVSKASLN